MPGATSGQGQRRNRRVKASPQEVTDGPPSLRGADVAEVVKRPTKASRFRQYAVAFAEGLAKATGTPHTPPAVKGPEDALVRLLQTHANGADGKPLRGDDVLSWIRREVEVFRRHAPEDVRYKGEWTPRGFAWWLDEGRPGLPRAKASAQRRRAPEGYTPPMLFNGMGDVFE